MSRVVLTPPLRVDFSASVPGSKSLTNRALIAASLADGTSRLSNASLSDDSRILVAALHRVGVSIHAEGTTLTVKGIQEFPFPISGRFEMGNAGTSLRFFTALTSLGSGECVIDGDARMRERPVGGLVDALRRLGAEVHCTAGVPPVTVRPRGLVGGRVEIDGGTSSQFLSAVLLAAPGAREAVELAVRGPVASRSYIEMTMRTMETFGIRPHREESSRFRVSPGRYVPCDCEVEGDSAAANYFFAMAAVSGGRVRVGGLGRGCAQPEYGFVEVLERMGCRVERGTEFTEVSGGRLRAIEIDMNDLPDSAQTLAVTALFADGRTTIRNVANLRLKETDRIASLARELRKFGAGVEERPDGLSIDPPREVGAAEVETYRDHRMAMSFSVVGAVRPVTILDPECVSKSFPGYFERLAETGFGVSR